MRGISIIVPELRARDGVGNVVIEMARAAAMAGWDCTIYSYVLNRRYVPSLPKQVRLKRVSLGELLYDPNFVNTDVIMYHYAVYCPLIESIKMVNKPRIVCFYGITPPDFALTHRAKILLERSLFGLFLLGYADLVCVNSNFIKTEMLGFFGNEFSKPIRVLPLFADLRKYTPGPKSEYLLRQLKASRILLFVGRVTNNKRIDVLIRAMPIVREHCPGAKLVIVGDWTSSEEYRKTKRFLEDLAKENNIKENIIFTGSVKDTVPYYRTADLFVTASEHEGFCMPIVEAMACGTPVIAANTSAIPETVGDGGLLFSPGNHMELAQQIIRLLSSEEERRFWVEKGLNRAKEFSIDRFYENFMALISEAIDLNQSFGQAQPGWIDLPVWFKSISWMDLQNMADIALRDYRIRSRIPILGRLIEMIRYHLTSHIKEAYLDPIVERQVMFNYQVVRLLYELSRAREDKQ